MLFDYTDHALLRMGERNVSREEIEYAIANPDVVLPGKSPGTQLVYFYTQTEARLGVVFKIKDGGKRALVITCYWNE